jgi:hypothetical protein
MIVAYFTLWTDRKLTLYDDNFKILDYSITRGSRHTIYHGNQNLGRTKDMLRKRLGFKFINQPHMSVIAAPEGHALLLRYEGDFPFEELMELRAVLTNDKNISKELFGINMAFSTKQIFIKGFLLPGLPESEDSFRIELKLESADDPVACLNIGKLYKHNRRSN